MQCRVRALGLAVMTAWTVLHASEALAQGGIFTGMQAGVDAVFSSNTTKITTAAGTIQTTSTNTFPTFTLNLNSMPYPGLRLNLGGMFELNTLTTTVSGLKRTSQLTRSRPFFFLRSTNPVLSPGVGYFRRMARDRSQGVSGVSLTNDEYSAFLGWHPEGGPQSDFQFLRTNTFDGDRVVQDLTKDFGSVISQYHYRRLGLYYRGSYLNTADTIAALDTRQVSNALRTNYSQTFIGKRLLWNASGDLDRQDFRTVAEGPGGEVAFPITPFAGLAAVSDTPITAPLTTNPQLIDGNLSASANIDLGVPATPADGRLRNIGLDLLTPTEVNRLLVWVDRELPLEISNAFSWDVYSSPDNVIWKRETTVPVAPFGAFENRFEIDFPNVAARYVKVVTRPLSQAVPDSSRFQDIFVTEIQAFVTRPAGQAAATMHRSHYLINTNVRLRLLDKPKMFYEGYYFADGSPGASPTTDTLSSGVSLNHTFNRVFSTYARLAYEQGRQPQGHRVATVTNASFTVEPIPAFRSSIMYSGQEERVADVPGDRRGLFIQNAARPYSGIDILFGFGWTSMTRPGGETSHDQLANFSAAIAPLERFTVTVNYDARTTVRSDRTTGDVRSREHRTYVAIAWDPIRTLHVVLGGEYVAGSGQTRSTLDIGTSWSPFPDGTLQFVLAYNEAIRALEFGQERTGLAVVRWNLSRKSFVDVSYQRIRSANQFQTNESSILSARVRLFL